ncbi:RNA 2',3'-cyclic phosphodiesterase [Denitratisoma sp. DHT3]|uniref:RNA 2',3'-cyclic phosphodiesterase n=1 Tax=Denitratisoma sp. DHT3 TaxID=1981880 RepID=UPI00119855A1|nr:RNA 2',3'-cyclic phosphodiesterase [Denitratisoma sp. DHT3]QDX81076.1 RNA 2',3'-cyclic phosphodiesterase [Denitratisoma sp. DHT3]
MESGDGSGSRRLFFALWPPAEQADALHRLAVDAEKLCGGRAMARHTLHLTLAFLGRVEEARLPELRAMVDDMAGAIKAAAFDLVLDRLDYWRHNRILWAGCETMPPGLEVLAERLQETLRGAGYALERRRFAAHVTLLRNARCPAPPPLTFSLTWPVTGFVLVESRSSTAGADYQVLERWPLS